MKEKLLSYDDVRKMSPILRGPFGNILIKFAMWLTGMNKVNRIYDTSKQHEGPEFCKHLLQDVGVNIVVENIEVLNQYEGASFITVSNHAYGGFC